MESVSNGVSGKRYKGVIFDLGGVIYPHPKRFILEYCFKKAGLSKSEVLAMFAYDNPETALAQWEVGNIIDFDDFDAKLTEQCRRLKGTQTVDLNGFGRDFEAELLTYKPYKEMLECIRTLHLLGYKTALLTNNFYMSNGPIQPMEETLFDVVVQSCVERVRKPDPRIYQLTLDRLGLDAADAIFLDDIYANVKTARELGIRSIEVVDPLDALVELENILDCKLNPQFHLQETSAQA